MTVGGAGDRRRPQAPEAGGLGPAGDRRRPQAPEAGGLGRVLGVDVGEVRVGVAVSDPTRRVATPLETVDAGPDLASRLAGIAAEHECDTVVVGLPKALSGRDTASTRRARELADALTGHGLRVELWDERLSSAEAERILLAADRRRSQRRAERDRVAATLILQGWLQARGVVG